MPIPSFRLKHSADMGCPLCKDQGTRPSMGFSGLDAFVRKASLRSSRPTAVAGAVTTSNNSSVSAAVSEQQQARISSQNCTLEFQQQQSSSDEPPIYFLSGNPALKKTPMTPPKKAPRTSGWKDATLRAAVAAEVSRTSSNSLYPPDQSTMKHSTSTTSMKLPEETAQHLEEYLRKNPSITSLSMLMDVLQSQTGIEGSSSGEEEDAQEESWIPPVQRPKSPTPNPPTRVRRENAPPSYAPPPPPLDEEESSEQESLVLRGHWDTDKSTPTKSPITIPSTPISRNENMSPCTPGPWFDGGMDGFPETGSPDSHRQYSPIPVMKRHSPIPKVDSQPTVTKQILGMPRPMFLQPQITPPPSLNNDDDDEEHVDSMPREITHSILLKVLQQCSDDFGNNKLLSRRASVIPSNIPLEGLHDFIQTLQKPEENDEDGEETNSISPSIGELENALAELLVAEKINEKKLQPSEA
ncbi:hypothetical protein B566_EDAN004094 [Ephemera danica]|nr:hypothetical protein B566_EDAN004094 [Ephemera danica]